jgi:hypothetical protein
MRASKFTLAEALRVCVATRCDDAQTAARRSRFEASECVDELARTNRTIVDASQVPPPLVVAG